MKETADNRFVPARCWYYLLDYNDRYGKELMLEIAPDCGGRLANLTFDQFWSLFGTATARDSSGAWATYDNLDLEKDI